MLLLNIMIIARATTVDAHSLSMLLSFKSYLIQRPRDSTGHQSSQVISSRYRPRVGPVGAMSQTASASASSDDGPAWPNILFLLVAATVCKTPVPRDSAAVLVQCGTGNYEATAWKHRIASHHIVSDRGKASGAVLFSCSEFLNSRA